MSSSGGAQGSPLGGGSGLWRTTQEEVKGQSKGGGQRPRPHVGPRDGREWSPLSSLLRTARHQCVRVCRTDCVATTRTPLRGGKGLFLLDKGGRRRRCGLAQGHSCCAAHVTPRGRAHVRKGRCRNTQSGSGAPVSSGGNGHKGHPTQRHTTWSPNRRCRPPAR